MKTLAEKLEIFNSLSGENKQSVLNLTHMLQDVMIIEEKSTGNIKVVECGSIMTDTLNDESKYEPVTTIKPEDIHSRAMLDLYFVEIFLEYPDEYRGNRNEDFLREYAHMKEYPIEARDFRFTYDRFGNIVPVLVVNGEPCEYVYDDFNKLVVF